MYKTQQAAGGGDAGAEDFAGAGASAEEKARTRDQLTTLTTKW